MSEHVPTDYTESQTMHQSVLNYFESRIAEASDHINTHCAHIFLIGDFAYKLKRDIQYTYLDMSSVGKRKLLCQREFELNSPELPDIYLDVVPITMDKEHAISIDGIGEPVEWALKMRRFPEDQVLDNIAARGELSLSLAKDIGRSIAGYHQSLSSLTVADGHLRIQEVYEELLVELNKLDDVFTSAEIGTFRSLGRKELSYCKESLDRRAVDGFIKRCHGDLHLRNILLTSAGPVPFDALEFDERMAKTDVLYDIAFLLMDMAHREMAMLTNATLNEYLLYSPPAQCSGLLNLPLFLYCRAGIRAMTTAQAASQHAGDTQELHHLARQYLSEANAYLHKPNPRLITIAGLSGTGKSSVAGRVAFRVCQSPGAILLRSDAERKAMAGVRETEHLPESHYTQENSDLNYQHMFTKATMALESGATVIIDAVFHNEKQREQIEQVARRVNVPFTGLWLEAPESVLIERINRRHKDASDATVHVLRKQLRKPTGALNWTRIDASKSLERTIKLVETELVANV